MYHHSPLVAPILTSQDADVSPVILPTSGEDESGTAGPSLRLAELAVDIDDEDGASTAGPLYAARGLGLGLGFTTSGTRKIFGLSALSIVDAGWRSVFLNVNLASKLQASPPGWPTAGQTRFMTNSIGCWTFSPLNIEPTFKLSQ